MTGTQSAMAVVMGISCFMVVMGAALPWFEFRSGSVSGIEGPAVVTLIPALVVAALFFHALITKRWHALVKIGLVVFSIWVAFVGIYVVGHQLLGNAGLLEMEANTEFGDIGIGLWMTMWGGVGMVVASIWGRAKRNSAIDNSP